MGTAPEQLGPQPDNPEVVRKFVTPEGEEKEIWRRGDSEAVYIKTERGYKEEPLSRHKILKEDPEKGTRTISYLKMVGEGEKAGAIYFTAEQTFNKETGEWKTVKEEQKTT